MKREGTAKVYRAVPSLSRIEYLCGGHQLAAINSSVRP
jgi:hypothetical protein